MIEKVTSLQKKHVLSSTTENKLIQAYRSYAFDWYEKLFKKNNQVELSIEIAQDSLLPFHLLPSGIIVCSINEFVLRYPKIAQQYFATNKQFVWQEQALHAFVESCWTMGLVVYVPPKMVLEEIIVLQEFFEQSTIEKVLIIVEDGAQVTLKDTRAWHKSSLRATDIFVGKYAHLSFHYEQNHAADVIDNVRYSFYAAEQSSIEAEVILRGAQESTVWFDLFLQGKAASTLLKGAYVLNGTQQFTLHTRQIHQTPNTDSHLSLRGLLSDQSSATFKGLITIDETAVHTNAAQENKNIALSDDARVYSEPSLQVLTNDVQCAHGSAIGQLDKEQMFYLQSRAITKQKAKQLLLTSFLMPVVKQEKIGELLKKVA